MSNPQTILHSKNFDLCRLCMLEPEANRNVKFIDVFSAETNDPKLTQHIFKIYDIKINKTDVFPKIICQFCYKFVLSWRDMKKKSSEAQIVLNYINKKNLGTSRLPINESDSSEHSRNNKPSTTSYLPPMRSEHKSKVSSTHANFGSSSSISIQSTSSQMFTVHQFTKPAYNPASSSDDDSTSCELLNANEEVISISSENDETENESSKLHYCSICKQKNNYNHECFRYNKEFSTCLVPNCNILAKSIRDITPHLRQHMGIPFGAILCHLCFKENKITERDINGFHTNCIYNVFKCYMCNVIFKTMSEFATHKLKNHKGQLRDHNGHYLCLYCEITSTDMMMIVEHQKYCRDFQNKKKEKKMLFCTTKCKQPLKESTLNDDRNKIKQEFRKHKSPKFQNSSKHLLFTCLKPSCNLIFQNFATFKLHHREHFGIGNELMCWQCCLPFSNLNFLRMHQIKGNCRTPGMFKCYECPQDYDNLQSLSIHKYTEHNGKFIANKKGKRDVICVFCKIRIDQNDLKNHMINCELNNNEKTTSTPQQKRKGKFHKCSICDKKCLTLAALRSHEKVHNFMKKEMNSTSLKSELNQSVNIRDKTSTRDMINRLSSSTFQSNNKNMSMDTDEDMIPTSSNTSRINEKSKLDFTMFPFLGGLYSCIKCPKKFRNKKGLSTHWTFCSKVIPDSLPNLKNNLLLNYYCSECKEYYTRRSFGHHWQTHHGIKLFYSKKPFTCSTCSCKFVFKKALKMHIQHVHGIPVSSNADNDAVMLPIVYETTSLAKAIKDNYNKKTEDKENANTSRVKGEYVKELDINYNDDNNTDNVNPIAQYVNQINGSETEIVELITDEDAMEIDGTNDVKKNIVEDIFVDDDDNETPIISIKFENLNCSNEKNNTQNIYEIENDNEIINPINISPEKNLGTN